MTTADETMVREVVGLLTDALRLGSRGETLTAESSLLGSLPEFDSTAVLAVLTLVEERLGVTIEDDEVDAGMFRTVGTLADFVAAKLGRH